MLVKMESENLALKAKLHEVTRLLEGAAQTHKLRHGGGRDRPTSADHKLKLACLFPPCALISHAQGSSGVVENTPV